MLSMLKPSFRELARVSVNKLLGKVGLKLISSSWGPRGFQNALRRVKKQGIVPRQIVDIGAARGKWTQKCLEVFPDADYFLVDPLEENRGFLRELQYKHSKVQVWIGSLGAKADKLQLYIHGDQSSFLRSEYTEKEPQETRCVEVKTLDSLLANNIIKPPDMIKTDTQGYEIEVLKGAEKCLESTELLLLEVLYRRLYENCPIAHDVISYVGSKGFRFFDICTYVKRPYDGELGYSDILFVREDSRLFEYEGWDAR